MTYIPSPEDLEWTMGHIQNKRLWAIPSIGCALVIDHDNMIFDTWMKSEPTEEETLNFEAVDANLTALGYTERHASIIGGTRNVDDVLFAIRRAIERLERDGKADATWISVRDSIDRLLDSKGA